MMPVIGIDLGTSTSCVAVWQDGVVNVLPNEQGKRTTHSYVAFDDRERHLGSLGKNQLTRKPTNTVFAAKRLIGRRFNDPAVQDDIELWPFSVVDVGGKPKVSVKFKKNEICFTAEEISAMMLLKMKQIAENLVGDVKEAVIAVPASFNDSQRQATIDAGTIAGLDVIRIINEPTAAALAFGLGKQLQGKHNLLIFDLGGGHLDVSIITIEDGSKYTVQATAGDSHLGGEDFDNVLLRHLAHEFIVKESKYVYSNPRAMQRLRIAAEAAKITLSSLPTASIEIDDLLDGVDFHTTVSREVFETLCADMFASTMEYVKKVLQDANMDTKNVDRVVLVGGSTRIPKIQSLLQEMFDGKEFDLTINRDEAVAVGAAIQAAVLSGAAPSLHLSDVTSAYTIAGIAGDVIGRNTVYPCSKRVILPITDKQVTKIEVYERGNDLNNSGTLVGRCDLEISSLSPANRLIQLDLEVNQNGILQVAPLYCGDDVIRYKYVVTECLLKAEVDELRAEAERQLEDERCEHARVNARHELEKHAYSALTFLNNVDTKQRDEAWTDLKLKAKGTLLWIDQNKEECKLAFTSRLQQIKEDHQSLVRRVQGDDGDNILETQKTVLLERLATRVVEVKSDIYKIEEKLRDSDWTEFVKLCDYTELWIKNNQNASQKEIKTQLDILESQLGATRESLQKYETQLQEEQRKEEEERIRAQEQRKEEEERIRAQEQRKEDEERIRVQEQRKEEEERIRVQEQRKEEEERIRAQEQRKEEEERIRAQEQRKEEEERIRAQEQHKEEEERIRVQEQRKVEEERIRAQEQRKEDEERIRAQEQHKEEEERIRAQEQLREEEERIRAQEQRKEEEEGIRAQEQHKEEEERIRARDLLETFLSEVQKAVSHAEGHVSKTTWKLVVQRCKETEEWIEKNRESNKAVFEEKLTNLKQEYGAMKVKLKEEKKLKDDMEKQRVEARNQLETYIDQVKSDMLQECNLRVQPGYSYWDDFVRACEEELIWHQNNQMESKEQYEEQLLILEQLYNFTMTKLKKRQSHIIHSMNDEEERKIKVLEYKRIAAQNQLKKYILDVQVVMNNVEEQLRSSDWSEYVNLLADTLKWIKNNQGASKGEFYKHLNNMKKQNAATTASIQQNKCQLDRINEQQRIASRSKLEEYVEEVRAHDQDSEWEKFDKLCDETVEWILDNQGAGKEAFEEKLTQIEDEYKMVCSKLQNIQQLQKEQEAKLLEESELRRVAARRQLAKYVKDVRATMFQRRYSQFDSLENSNFVTYCDEALSWIRDHQYESEEIYDQKLAVITSEYESTIETLVQLAKIAEHDAEKKRLIQKLDKQKKAAKYRLSNYVVQVKSEINNVPLQNRNSDCKEFVTLCDKTLHWIRKNQEESKEAFEKTYEHISSRYDITTTSLRNHQEEKKRAEEVEEQRVAARNRLQSFVKDTRPEFFKPDYYPFRNAEKIEFVDQCDKTLNWLHTNQRNSKVSFENRLAVMKSKYDSTLAAFEKMAQVQKNEDHKAKLEEIEKGKTTARLGFEKYVVGMKSEMSQVLPKHRNVAWQNFDKLCDETLNWIRSNQDASKEDFEVKHENMNHQYKATIESLRNQEKEETRMEQLEQQRLTAEKQLRQSVITIKTEMDQIQHQHRNPAWDECVNLCNNIQSWLSKNPEASKDACEDLYHLLQRQYQDTTERLKKYQDLLTKQEEEEKMKTQRYEAKRHLQEYVAVVKIDMNQPAYNQLRNLDWHETVKLCDDISKWLRNNPDSSKGMCEGKLNDLQRQHAKTKASLRAYQRFKEFEEIERRRSEERRVDARNRLDTNVKEVKSSLHQHVFVQVHNEDWKEMIRFCNETLKWLSNNQEASRRMFEDKLDVFVQKNSETVTKLYDTKQRQRDQMQRAEDLKRQQVELEHHRITARAKLKQYVLGAKASMQHIETKYRNTDWHTFERSCDDMVRWIEMNPEASKDMFEGHLENMRRDFAGKKASLMAYRTEYDNKKCTIS